MQIGRVATGQWGFQYYLLQFRFTILSTNCRLFADLSTNHQLIINTKTRQKYCQLQNTQNNTFVQVMVELFPDGCWAGWFSNQNEQRALVSHGPLWTHVTSLFLSQ